MFNLKSWRLWLLVGAIAAVILLYFIGWKWALAALGATAAGAASAKAAKLKQKADALREDAAREEEAQKIRLEEAATNAAKAEENAAKAEALDERLEKLKKKHGLLPLALIGALLLASVGIPARAADSQALPPDYTSIAKMYLGALELIADLRKDLEEAISIAEGYKQCYETEKQLRATAQDLREETEAAVTRGLEREATLQAIIDQQAATIAQQQAVIERQNETIKSLARNSLVAAILGILAGGLVGQ